MKTANSRVDGQKSRSLVTQKALMEAAEKLVAKKGLAHVSIKEIVKEAGQKNESALQYHFKNFKGLLQAIHQQRSAETHAKRAELLEVMLAETDAESRSPTIRDLCQMMVMPTYLLAKHDARYRRYVAAFSHELALMPDSVLVEVSRKGGGGASGHKTGELLRQLLPQLDEQSYRQRMEMAVRLCSISMGHQAKQKQAFKGPQSEYFISSLIDALEGLLTAPVSDESRRHLRQL